jgi:hypothetical protein
MLSAEATCTNPGSKRPFIGSIWPHVVFKFKPFYYKNLIFDGLFRQTGAYIRAAVDFKSISQSPKEIYQRLEAFGED